MMYPVRSHNDGPCQVYNDGPCYVHNDDPCQVHNYGPCQVPQRWKNPWGVFNVGLFMNRPPPRQLQLRVIWRAPTLVQSWLLSPSGPAVLAWTSKEEVMMDFT